MANNNVRIVAYNAALLGVNRVTLARRETGAQVITTEAWLALLALPKLRKNKA